MSETTQKLPEYPATRSRSSPRSCADGAGLANIVRERWSAMRYLIAAVLHVLTSFESMSHFSLWIPLSETTSNYIPVRNDAKLLEHPSNTRDGSSDLADIARTTNVEIREPRDSDGMPYMAIGMLCRWFRCAVEIPSMLC